MTSNQIANASNMINQQLADERVRNDQAIEAETNRHNVELESINKEANAINKERLSLENQWENQKYYLDKWYKEEYLKWQKAQGEKKLEIENTLAGIEHQKAVADQEYKTNMSLIADREASVKERAQREVEAVNEWTRSQRERELNLKSWQTFINEKSVEYQNTYWNASISLGNLNAVYNREHNLQQYELGALGLERDLAALKRDAARLEFDKAVNAEDQTRNWILGIGNMIFGGIRGTTGLWMYGLPSPNFNLGGLKNGSK